MSVVSKPFAPRLRDRTAPAALPIYRLSVDQYHQMLDAGILTENDPVELLKGWLVQKMGKNPPHSSATLLSRQSLERLLPAGWHVRIQEPITTEDSEPEPDVAVVRGDSRQYVKVHPRPTDVGLLMEVSETTLEYDRGFKKGSYAEALIPIYWILNLLDNVVEVYTDPTGPGENPDYGHCHIYRAGEEIPLVIDGREVGRIAVRNLLP